MATLEFTLPPSESEALLRLPQVRRSGGRAAVVETLWHDTADCELSAATLSLAESKGRWRLERSRPDGAALWPPATPAPAVAEAGDVHELGDLPAPLMPMAGFRGQRRLLRWASDETVSATLTEGTIRGLAREKPVCRLELDGPAPALAAITGQIAETVCIEVPRWSLAAEALAFARNQRPLPRRTGAPEVPPGMTVGDAIVCITGHLTDVILASVADAAAGETPEPVHAMRVAVRRLRSALSVFRKAAFCPQIDAARAGLHSLAAVLGEARDWDVFLAGVGQDIASALPGDARIEWVLTASRQQRERAYANLRREFASPAFRALSVSLALLPALRPWEWDADEDRQAMLEADAGDYATAFLTRRHDHILNPGPDISLLPAVELHELRKQGKRLRYAAEFFAPIYGRRSTRRFVRSVSRLQEALGHLNDGQAAGELMARLRGGGPERHFAAGAVQGFAAARGLDARGEIAKTWSKFRRTEAFWT